MPICRICKVKFPNRIYIEGKHKNVSKRKYCLSCSPFGLHNTKKLGLDCEKLDYNRTCKICSRKYFYDKKKGHTLNKCNSCSSNHRWKENRLKSIEYKGGCCIVCGYKRCVEGLCFHHVDPTTKLFEISGNYCRQWEVLKTELDKCLLMCMLCHVEFHAGVIEMPIIHKKVCNEILRHEMPLL